MHLSIGDLGLKTHLATALHLDKLSAVISVYTYLLLLMLCAHQAGQARAQAACQKALAQRVLRVDHSLQPP